MDNVYQRRQGELGVWLKLPEVERDEVRKGWVEVGNARQFCPDSRSERSLREGMYVRGAWFSPFLAAVDHARQEKA